MADLENLEQLARAATPGRWSEIERCNNADDDRSCGVTSDQKTAYGHAIGIFRSDAYDECSHPVSRANAAFIAAANPETVLKLIAERARLRAGLEWALGALGDIQQADSYMVDAEQRRHIDELHELLESSRP